MKKLLCLLLCIIVLMPSCAYYDLSFNIESGETSKTGTTNTASTSEYAAHYGLELNLSLRPPKTLNPLTNNDESVDRILKLIFEPLCEVKEDMRPVPNLVSRLDFSADGKSVMAVIRDDIFWADGVKLNSGDIKFSVDVLQSQNGSDIYKNIVSEITSVEIVDSSRFRVRFSKPQGGIGYGLCFPVIPKHYYSGSLDDDDRESFSPLGNGLYKVGSIKPAKEIELVVNENSFRNKPYIENINIIIIDDKETAFQAFDQNIIDAIDTDSMAFGKYSGSNESVICPYDTNYYTFLGFNFKNLLFEDKRVREAIAYAIDKAYVSSSIYLDKSRLTTSVINPASYLYEPSAKEYEFNLEAARNLIFQAGFRDNDLDGYLDIEVAGSVRKLEFRLLVNDESPERMKIALSVKENLEKLGLTVNIISSGFESYTASLAAGEFDLFIGTYNFSLKPDFSFAFHSEGAGGTGNYLNYRSDVMDALIKDAAEAKTESELKTAISNLQKHIASDLPCVSIVFVQKALLIDQGIKGDKKPLMNNIYSNIAQWKIE